MLPLFSYFFLSFLFLFFSSASSHQFLYFSLFCFSSFISSPNIFYQLFHQLFLHQIWIPLGWIAFKATSDLSKLLVSVRQSVEQAFVEKVGGWLLLPHTPLTRTLLHIAFHSRTYNSSISTPTLIIRSNKYTTQYHCHFTKTGFCIREKFKSDLYSFFSGCYVQSYSLMKSSIFHNLLI